MTIVFDILGANGHLNGTFKFATLLKEAGFRIVYASQNEYSELIIKNGFEFFNVPDSFYNLKVTENPIPKYKNSFSNKKIDLQCDILMDPFFDLISIYNPVFVFLDSVISNKFVPYHIKGIPLSLIQTTLATDRVENLPPLCSSLIPATSFLYNFRNNLEWNIIFYKRIILRYLWKLYIYRIQSVTLYYNLLKRYQIPGKLLNTQRFSLFSINCYPEIILGPQVFDFPRKPLNNQYFLGPLVDLNRNPPEDLRYINLIDSFQKQKANSTNIKIIYVSLGTLTKYEVRRSGTFFNKIVKLASESKNWNFIISVGKYYDINELKKVPQNVYIFRNVPQIHLLDKIDAMITHAGLNTVTECVFKEVPMLAYPFMTTWDQKGNAARIVFHGLGLRGKLKWATPSSIKNKLQYILDNYDFFKTNLRKKHQEFDEKNNSSEPLELVKKLIKEAKNIKL